MHREADVGAGCAEYEASKNFINKTQFQQMSYLSMTTYIFVSYKNIFFKMKQFFAILSLSLLGKGIMNVYRNFVVIFFIHHADSGATSQQNLSIGKC